MNQRRAVAAIVIMMTVLLAVSVPIVSHPVNSMTLNSPLDYNIYTPFVACDDCPTTTPTVTATPTVTPTRTPRPVP